MWQNLLRTQGVHGQFLCSPIRELCKRSHDTSKLLAVEVASGYVKYRL